MKNVSHGQLFLHAHTLSETPLFPRGALEYYTKKNMGWEYTKEESEQWQLDERGGAQGDYRDGVRYYSITAKRCSDSQLTIFTFPSRCKRKLPM